MKKIYAIIIVILLIGGVGFWFYKNNEFKGWQTYVNSTYGYEIKYPNQWKAQPSPTSGDNGFGLLQTFTIVPTYDSKTYAEGFSPELVISVEDGNNKMIKAGLNSADSAKSEQTKFNGYDAKKFSGDTSDPLRDIAGDRFVLTRGDKIFIITVPNVGNHGIDSKLLDKTLSTFKFTK